MIPIDIQPQDSEQNYTQYIQGQRATTIESMLGQSNAKLPYKVKMLLLRFLTQQEIRENEKQEILTSVSLFDMQHQQSILQHNENEIHFAASVNKLPVTMLVLEELRSGNATLDTVLTWQESDRRDGAGVFDAAGSPLQATVGEVLTDLLTRSGNTAVRILVNDMLDGSAQVNERLAAVPQLQHTRLIPLDENRFYLGNTTSKEALFVMQKLMQNQDVYGRYVKNALVNNIYTDISVKSQLGDNGYIVLVNKIGLLDDPDGNNRHDVGIVYNTKTHKAYGFAYLTTSPAESETATPLAEQSLKDMGRYLLRFSGDKHEENTLMVPKSRIDSQTESKKIVY